jgi:hypothetical protein
MVILQVINVEKPYTLLFIEVRKEKRALVRRLNGASLQEDDPETAKDVNELFRLLGGSDSYDVLPQLGHVVSSDALLEGAELCTFWYD